MTDDVPFDDAPKRAKVQALATCNLDDDNIELDEATDGLELMLDNASGPDGDKITEDAIAVAVELALANLARYGVYEDVPASDAVGKKHVTTRFENQWRWNEEAGDWVVKARFVAREYK